MMKEKEKKNIFFLNKNRQAIMSIKILGPADIELEKIHIRFMLTFHIFIEYDSLMRPLINSTIQLFKKLNPMHLIFAGVDASATHKKFTKTDKELLTINDYSNIGLQYVRSGLIYITRCI
ncbi:MAG: hypothetical protein ABI863_04475 [Ginsengibacter sp.]